MTITTEQLIENFTRVMNDGIQLHQDIAAGRYHADTQGRKDALVRADAYQHALKLFAASQSPDPYAAMDQMFQTEAEAERAVNLDPNSKWQMYSPAGNAAVAQMVAGLVGRIDAGEVGPFGIAGVTRDAMNALAKTHAEVWDTEPRGAIYDAIDAAADRAGYKTPLDF